jgi:SAM-dependent methyltransferase
MDASPSGERITKLVHPSTTTGGNGRARSTKGSESAEEWRREIAQMAGALTSFGATGDVLELAGGTGWWTAHLARTAAYLTVIDSSPASLELSRKRVGRPDVDYIVPDLFTWQLAPTSSGVIRIWSSAAFATEGSSRSSRSSMCLRSCRHFSGIKAGRRA